MSNTEPSETSMLDPAQIIADFQKNTARSAVQVQQLLQPQPGLQCFALGRNEHTQQLLGLIPLNGIIDDFAAPTSLWHDLPVIHSTEIPAGAIVINCAMSISPLNASKRIAALEHVRGINYADLCRAPNSPIGLPDFVAQARAALNTDYARYARVCSLLVDDESKRIFNRLMAYRLTADPEHMQGFSVRLQDQYFESFLGKLKDVVFVDCGGYDGDTSEIFASRYPDYARIHFFEPSSVNMQRARARLVPVRDIDFIELGVSDAEGSLQFDADAGSASSVLSMGGIRIDVTTLDAHLDEPVGFIKMDLEGWELTALKGAERHLREDRPILAIAVYHHIADFWKIPEYVLTLQPEYDIYLRHYTEGWSETVMYFVPRQPH